MWPQSTWDQEMHVPQSLTADQHMVLQGWAIEHWQLQDTKETIKVKQASLSSS